jgi:type I restriction enzyme, S subunit
MPNQGNWLKTTLRVISSKIGSGATPRGGKESYKEEGISLIRSMNVYDFNFGRTGLARIDEAQAKELNNVSVEQNDILINITGASVARCCIVPNDLLPARVNQHVSIVRIIPEIANPHFILYLLNSPYYKQFLLNLSQGGATREALTKEKLEEFKVSLPSLETQNKIASILSAYDDLIENNTRRIQILEEMAQAIYREWFVEFRFPGHESTPMVESPLGLIPAGWGPVYYKDLLISYTGGDWGEEESSGNSNTQVSIIRGTDFPSVNHGGALATPTRYITQSSFQKRQLQVGNIVIENSINAKSRCVGTPLLITNGILSRLKGDVICASFCKNFRLVNPNISPIVYLHLLHLYTEGRMAFFQHVATNGIGNFQAERFVNSEYLLLPKDNDHTLRLVEQIKPLVSGIFSDQIYNLRQQRDLLLPRLINGELDI